jgi:hypothetical protein
MLCTLCSNFDLDALTSPDGYAHHASCTSLLQSAQNGCPFCSLILDAQWTSIGGNLTADIVDKGGPDTQIKVRAIGQKIGGLYRIRYGQEARFERREINSWGGDMNSFLWCFIEIAADRGSLLSFVVNCIDYVRR